MLYFQFNIQSIIYDITYFDFIKFHSVYTTLELYS